MEKYNESIKIDVTNEYAYANMGLIHLKKLKYEQCIEYSTKALDQIESFMNDTKSYQRRNQFEVKIRQRRGTAFQKLENYEMAIKDFDLCQKLDP